MVSVVPLATAVPLAWLFERQLLVFALKPWMTEPSDLNSQSSPKLYQLPTRSAGTLPAGAAPSKGSPVDSGFTHAASSVAQFSWKHAASSHLFVSKHVTMFWSEVFAVGVPR